MDRVFIKALQLETVVGVYGWERETRQLLTIDLEMAWDVATAAGSDDVGRALDYAKVSARMRELAAGSSVQLIETLAEHLAASVLEEFSVRWLRLTVNKPGAVPGAETVGVTIERGELPQ